MKEKGPRGKHKQQKPRSTENISSLTLLAGWELIKQDRQHKAYDGPDWQQAYRHRDVNTVLPDVVTFTFENL